MHPEGNTGRGIATPLLSTLLSLPVSNVWDVGCVISVERHPAHTFTWAAPSARLVSLCRVQRVVTAVATLTDPTMVHLLQVMGQDMGRARGPR